jgi:hypothetical protein
MSFSIQTPSIIVDNAINNEIAANNLTLASTRQYTFDAVKPALGSYKLLYSNSSLQVKLITDHIHVGRVTAENGVGIVDAGSYQLFFGTSTTVGTTALTAVIPFAALVAGVTLETPTLNVPVEGSNYIWVTITAANATVGSIYYTIEEVPVISA